MAPSAQRLPAVPITVITVPAAKASATAVWTARWRLSKSLAP